MTNQELLTFFFDCFNRHDLDAVEPMIDPNIIMHDTFMGETSGIEQFKALGAMFLAAFPDQHTTILKIVNEGDLVACLHKHEGTHLGDFAGAPPTGRSFSINGLELFRINDGKITEFWRHDDEAGLLRQLGMVPEPAGEQA